MLSFVCRIDAQEQLSATEQIEATTFARDFLSAKDSSLSFDKDSRFNVEHIDKHIVVLGCRNPRCGIILIRSEFVDSSCDRVLGYSTESTIRPSSNSMKALLGYYETIVEKSIVNGVVSFPNGSVISSYNGKRKGSTVPQEDIVGPLLKNYELNQFTFSDDVAGTTYTRKASCGIVRLIQLMLYYNYPTTIPNYRCELGHASNLKQIIPKDSLLHLDHFINETITDIINHRDGRREIKKQRTVDIDAITPLARFIATATDSEYHTGWTMTNNQGTMHVLTEHLGFSRKLNPSHSSTVGEMYGRVSRDLAQDHPVLVSGGGHGFICDGITSDGYLHFNLGWGGPNNGWYRFPIGEEKLRTGFLHSYITGVVPRKS